MITMNSISESRQIVRAYSFEVEERLPPERDAHGLAHVLAQHQESRDEARDPWRSFFESSFDSKEFSNSNPITRVLAIETSQLCAKWKAFVKSSTAVGQLNIKTSEPTMDGVIHAVHEIQRAWDSKRSNGRLARAKRFFHQFCATLNSHKSFLEVLPSGNEYVSIFTGTLNVLIQASANHEKIAEGLSESLCIISQHAKEHEVDLKLFEMEDMQALIAELYAHIFLFLGSIMDWMMKKRVKRLLDSFNDDLPSIFENEMNKIKGISDRIRYLASQKSRAELRSTRLTVESSARDLRAGFEGEKRHQAEVKHYAESIMREQSRISGMWTAEKQQQLADNIFNMLEEKAVRWLENNRAEANRQRLSSTTFISLGEPTQVSEYASEAVAICSRQLEDFFYRDRIRLSHEAFDSIMVPPESFREIGDWARASAPKLLWLEGPHVDGDDFENPVTMMAATVIALAEKTKLPVISYFCQLRRGEKLRNGNDSMEAQAMLSLVYALIRQLIELLPPFLDTSVDLSEGRFKALGGSLGTWSQATSILADLGELMPGPVLCIIDGLHWLTDRETDNYLSDLLKILRGDKWKVLLFTTGRSVVLQDELSRSEISTVDVHSFGRGVALDRQDFDE